MAKLVQGDLMPNVPLGTQGVLSADHVWVVQSSLAYNPMTKLMP